MEREGALGGPETGPSAERKERGSKDVVSAGQKQGKGSEPPAAGGTESPQLPGYPDLHEGPDWMVQARKDLMFFIPCALRNIS